MQVTIANSFSNVECSFDLKFISNVFLPHTLGQGPNLEISSITDRVHIDHTSCVKILMVPGEFLPLHKKGSTQI